MSYGLTNWDITTVLLQTMLPPIFSLTARYKDKNVQTVCKSVQVWGGSVLISKKILTLEILLIFCEIWIFGIFRCKNEKKNGEQAHCAQNTKTVAQI